MLKFSGFADLTSCLEGKQTPPLEEGGGCSKPVAKSSPRQRKNTEMFNKLLALQTSDALDASEAAQGALTHRNAHPTWPSRSGA